MPYNNSVATSMYNTRSTSYMNRICHDDTMVGDHAVWGEDDYVPTSCHSSSSSTLRMNAYKGRSSSPMDQGPEQSEKKSTRKRANTTSSSTGENKRTANKICRVCGDKAFSYNFNVITCESCKAFFRRNANKEKEIRCPFNEKCEINVVSRRFCQRCRLAKCFDVGMKKEWIMSDEARMEKKQRVEENRERRLQDALNRAGEDDSNDSEESMDDSPDPEPQSMTVRDYVMAEEPNKNPTQPAPPTQQPPQLVQQYIIKDESKPSMGMYANNSVDFSNHDYDFAGMATHSTSTSQLCNPHQVVDPIPTTGASSTADVSSTTTSLPTMDIDPTTTMTSNGFMPPSLSTLTEPSVIFNTAAISGGLLSQAQADVDQSLINAQAQAQAQLAAQVHHVQAAINHQQQQIAAAVVAQQVVAQMTAPSVQVSALAPVQPMNTMPVTQRPPISSTLPQMANTINVMNPIQTQMNPVIQPMLPKVNSPKTMLMTQMNHPNNDMVTIPREVLLSLIQNNALRTMACSCTCACGRYPPGSNIVEEVTKDLLNGGSSNSSSADPQREETKLDTAEDLQRNGLLPSDDSSVQWLNSTAPTVVDPSNYTEDMNNMRRDSVYNSLLDGSFSMLADAESREFTSQEKDKLEEVNEVANRWINDNLDSYQFFDLLSERGIRSIVNGIRMLSPFRFISKRDKKNLIKIGLYSYIVVKWIQHQESISLDGIDRTISDKLMSLLQMDINSFRLQPGTFNTLAVMALFDADDSQSAVGSSHSDREDYSKLLQKLISSNNQSMISDSQILYNILPEVHEAAEMLQKATGGINDILLNRII